MYMHYKQNIYVMHSEVSCVHKVPFFRREVGDVAKYGMVAVKEGSSVLGDLFLRD